MQHTDCTDMQLDDRLLLITAVFPPNKAGGADYALRLAREVAARGIDVTIATSTGCMSEVGNGVTCYPDIDKWSWTCLPKLLHMIHTVKPSVVDVHFTGWAYADHPMITLLPRFIRRHFPWIRLVTHIEFIRGIDRSNARFPTLIARKVVTHCLGRQGIDYEYGYLLEDSQCLVVLGEWEKRELCGRDHALEPKIMVVPPGPIFPLCQPLSAEQRSSVRRAIGFESTDFVIAYFGYVFPGKGLELLLEATEDISKSIPRVRLLVVGDSPEASVLIKTGQPNYIDKLKSMSAKLGVADRVVWSGYMQSDSVDASRYLRASDMVALPFAAGLRLHRSSFSFAAAHGLPIVSTTPDLLESVFRDGENVLLCPPNNVSELVQAIVRVYRDDSLRMKLAEGAERLSIECYSWSDIIDKSMSAYGFTMKYA